jgi:hypothetical protein
MKKAKKRCVINFTNSLGMKDILQYKPLNPPGGRSAAKEELASPTDIGISFRHISFSTRGEVLIK